MTIIKADIAQPIFLGKQGEHGVTRVEFNLSHYAKTYGDGVVQLVVKRPTDPLEYAILPAQADGKAVWEIGPEWTEFAGQGYCSLHWFVDDDHAKTDTFKTLVQEAKSACVDVPEPQAGYLDRILTAGKQAVDASAETRANADAVVEVARRFDADFKADVLNAAATAQTAATSAQESKGVAEAAKDAAVAAGSAAVESAAKTGEDRAATEEAAQIASAACSLASESASATQSALAAVLESKDVITAAAEQIRDDVARVENSKVHPATVGENGNWWEWDGEKYVDSGYTSVGRSIAGCQFNPQNGRWELSYTDGSITSVDGFDPVDSTIWSIMRDDFERYAPGENTFMEQAAADWRVSNGYPTDNVRHDVVQDGDNKYLMVRSLTGERATTLLQHNIQGEHIVEVDYMSTYQGAVTQGTTTTDCLDIRLFTVNGETLSAKVNNLGTNRIYTVIGGKKVQSPIIKDATGDFFLCRPGVWYRVKVYVRVGKITMKMWERDTDSEPADGSSYGVTEKAYDHLTPEYLAIPHDLRLYLGEFANVAVPDDGWRIGLDNVKVYRDTKDGVVEKVLAALPVYNGAAISVAEVESE